MFVREHSWSYASHIKTTLYILFEDSVGVLAWHEIKIGHNCGWCFVVTVVCLFVCFVRVGKGGARVFDLCTDTRNELIVNLEFELNHTLVKGCTFYALT